MNSLAPSSLDSCHECFLHQVKEELERQLSRYGYSASRYALSLVYSSLLMEPNSNFDYMLLYDKVMSNICFPFLPVPPRTRLVTVSVIVKYVKNLPFRSIPPF